MADLKLVKNAYYTEPADQAPWFYLKWLIQQLPDSVASEIDNINQLLSLEPDCPRTIHPLSYLITYF